MIKDEFDLYSEKVMQYFRKPVNMGKIANADAVATVGNPKCGDVMKVYLKVGLRPISERNKKPASRQGGQETSSKLKEEYIKDIKVQTLGCGAAIATSSIATEFVKGKSVDDALKLTNQRIVKELGGLPKVKYHCSLLAEQGIKEAIKNYQRSRESTRKNTRKSLEK